MANSLVDIVKGKRVLYIATKNMDYLRLQQEIDIIREYAADVTVIGSTHKGYGRRIMKAVWDIWHIDKDDFDVVFVGFLPQTIVPFFHSLFKDKTLIVDFFISLYDTLVFDRKKFGENSLRAKIVKWYDDRTIKKADHIIVDTKADAGYFAKIHNAPMEKMEVLYLKADTSIYYPMEVKRPEELKDKYIVLYFGSILPLQGVEVILECASMMEDINDIYFIMIGPINDDTYKKYSHLKNIEFINWLSQEELAQHIAMADLCLSGHFNKDIDKARRTIAGKTYIYRAMEKPVVLGENAANHELFNENMEGVYFVEMGSPVALRDKILKVYRGCRP